jgi:uridine phosphorylase
MFCGTLIVPETWPLGIAGTLDQEATTGKYVIPTAAYLDEGMSYHYASPSDYISIPKAKDSRKQISLLISLTSQL